MNWYVYLCLGTFLLGLFVVALAVRADIRRRAFNQTMAARPAIPLEAIYREGGYAPIITETQFISLWTKVARALEIDPRRLAPSDTFEQLRPRSFLGWGDPDGFDLLEMLPHHKWQLAEHVRTLDDFIRLIVHREHH